MNRGFATALTLEDDAKSIGLASHRGFPVLKNQMVMICEFVVAVFRIPEHAAFYRRPEADDMRVCEAGGLTTKPRLD